ncbi:MAG: hypothetical protein PHN59_06725 [Candidatus Omnitrophica bacterium]|nr:hypothetical protein [Candidatus Omnitrophota bacterium]
MKTLEKVLLVAGLILLALAAFSKLFGRPQIAMGVRIISLIILANTCFLLAVLSKICEKKQ